MPFFGASLYRTSQTDSAFVKRPETTNSHATCRVAVCFEFRRLICSFFDARGGFGASSLRQAMMQKPLLQSLGEGFAIRIDC